MAFLDEVRAGLLSSEQLEVLKRRFEEKLKAEAPRAAQRTIERIKIKIKDKIQRGIVENTSQGRRVSDVFGAHRDEGANLFGGGGIVVDFDDPQLELQKMANILRRNGELSSDDHISIKTEGGIAVEFYGRKISKLVTVARETRGLWGRKKIEKVSERKDCYGLSDLGVIFAKSLMEQAKREGIHIEIVCREYDGSWGSFRDRPVILEKVSKTSGAVGNLRINYSITF